MSAPLIARVDAGLALPFVAAYCRRWGVPLDNCDAAESIWWWGAFLNGRIRAIMGFQLIAEQTMFVWGFYGDGSGEMAERRALAKLTKLCCDLSDKLGYELLGVILLENSRMRRAARKHGWQFDEIEPAVNGKARWRWKRPVLREIKEKVG